ncbi:FtsW/RodA/SpoVE family cell cycle protein [Ktedonobacter sp. SOSP1-52]|uniref:FtsW/RodA/SpoVE family cell cycle protein n=1 Tax=Ktedonobacter sp. SOSP1-52 TaxID=2778366 RepID=UPI002103A2AF|nr:FtsW/RodA/SpoVE family cell cycle protein [Ktedonobacter sp. SOSP1-52]
MTRYCASWRASHCSTRFTLRSSRLWHNIKVPSKIQRKNRKNEGEKQVLICFSPILAVQTLVIMAGNLKLMPLTGIPLPFLSYGGSSILANFIIIGLLLRISHNTAVENGE